MLELRPFDSLGRFENGWLSSRFHFSFAEYFDPERMGFGPLRVWNDDRIAPAGGFPMHGHRDMEIITYVRSGTVTHEDHLGNRGRTEGGDVQVMTAGKGIMHSEFNHHDEPVELFQIWIEPAERRLRPAWATRRFPRDGRSGRLVPLASGRSGDEDEALPIHQDAAIFGATLAAGERIGHALAPGRRAYLVAAAGNLNVNGTPVRTRDGAAILGEASIDIEATNDAEIVLADLP